jgi:putative membrane protein
VLEWWAMFQRPGPYVEVHHGGHPVLGGLIVLLLLAAVVLGALSLWRSYRNPPAQNVSAPPVRDPALAELRLRYARGEVDRDEYLRRAADLGDVPPAPQQPPGNG